MTLKEKGLQEIKKLFKEHPTVTIMRLSALNPNNPFRCSQAEIEYEEYLRSSNI